MALGSVSFCTVQDIHMNRLKIETCLGSLGRLQKFNSLKSSCIILYSDIYLKTTLMYFRAPDLNREIMPKSGMS